MGNERPPGQSWPGGRFVCAGNIPGLRYNHGYATHTAGACPGAEGNRAMKRDELIQALEETRDRLDAVIEALSEAQLTEPGAADGWSVKDILAHLTAWEVDLLTNLGKARRGQKPGKTDWNAASIQAQNEKWYAEYLDRPLDRVLTDFHGVHRQVLRVLEDLSDQDLAAPTRWLQGRPLMTYFIGHVLDHEAEHLPQLEAWRQEKTAAQNGAG